MILLLDDSKPDTLLIQPASREGILAVWNQKHPRWFKHVDQVEELNKVWRHYQAAEEQGRDYLIEWKTTHDAKWILRTLALSPEWLAPYVDWCATHMGIPHHRLRCPENFKGIQGQVTHLGICSKFQLEPLSDKGEPLQVMLTAEIAEQTILGNDAGTGMAWLKKFVGREEPIETTDGGVLMTYHPALTKTPILRAFWDANRSQLTMWQKKVFLRHMEFCKAVGIHPSHPATLHPMSGQEALSGFYQADASRISWEEFVTKSRSISHDAETASNEELEAAAEILARLKR